MEDEFAHNVIFFIQPEYLLMNEVDSLTVCLDYLSVSGRRRQQRALVKTTVVLLINWSGLVFVQKKCLFEMFIIIHPD